MNGTRRHSENSGYLVILLLVVGLTAFSHSMKELTEIHQLTLDASRLVAQWSGNFTPAEIPQTSIQIVKVEKLESCESSEKLQRMGIDAGEFDVRIPSVQIPEAVESGSTPEIPAFTFRARARKPGAIKFNPRDREVILKMLNRSINLRIAS